MKTIVMVATLLATFAIAHGLGSYLFILTLIVSALFFITFLSGGKDNHGIFR